MAKRRGYRLGFGPVAAFIPVSITIKVDVTDGSYPEAVDVVDVPSHTDAQNWAARLASACRCPQEIWQVRDDP